MKTKGARTMSTAVSDSDREEVLGELEKYYADKAAAVAAKRAGRSQPTTPQEIVTDGTLNVKINAARKELVISWGGK
jgi:hypothetical protein